MNLGETHLEKGQMADTFEIIVASLVLLHATRNGSFMPGAYMLRSNLYPTCPPGKPPFHMCAPSRLPSYQGVGPSPIGIFP